ncbi:MAG: thioredoxin [candidate division KSB1 bacterium]|nr:thioredoxin [candidate division KSB1 bacterium]MDZ7337440.1 thioredoxin [candidate division KSB1 bacterium]MDZ7385513.1 thioredoxin [candidate division KSB1 bacterium]MDZ7393304.1 thioredoxin [candidate division KSB1 bacterium]MDZ7413160.1 thioredoxin [candidate division KSB1 bacterium]
MGKPVELTDANFASEVTEHKGLVLVDFWAEWCGPCRMVAPVVEKVAADYAGRLKVGKVNVDLHGKAAMTYGVTGIPTLILFKDGQVVDKIVGAVPEKELKKMVDRHLTPAKN